MSDRGQRLDWQHVGVDVALKPFAQVLDCYDAARIDCGGPLAECACQSVSPAMQAACPPAHQALLRGWGGTCRIPAPPPVGTHPSIMHPEWTPRAAQRLLQACCRRDLQPTSRPQPPGVGTHQWGSSTHLISAWGPHPPGAEGILLEGAGLQDWVMKAGPLLGIRAPSPRWVASLRIQKLACGIRKAWA